ncbi:MAG: serine/threonine protein kinase [Polyangiaceae bacterium]
MQTGNYSQVIDGKYQLVRKLGEGGMGAVYEGRHLGTARRVAVKVISTESLSKSHEVVSRFQREAMASGAIESQYIAHVLDTGIDPQTGSPYMVMELLVGEDVEQALKRIGPFSPELALRVIAQACLGLQKAHEANVVHRDIKPANIYLTRRDGGEIVAKILDFGIAKMKSEGFASTEGKSLTRTGTMLGSPLYMSPEQALGRKNIDHRTDIWSLGVVLYEALAGKAPHTDAETIGELIVNICHKPAPHIQDVAPWIPPQIAAIVHRALALDPAARFQTMADMFAAIRSFLPNGHTLDESMFVTLSPQARDLATSRLALAASMQRSIPGEEIGIGPAAVRTGQGFVSTGGTQRTSTTSGVAGDEEQPQVPKATVPLWIVWPMVAALVTGIGVAAVVVVHRMGGSPPVEPTTAAAPPPTATTAPPATVLAPLAPAPAATGAPSVTLDSLPRSGDQGHSHPAPPSGGGHHNAPPPATPPAVGKPPPVAAPPPPVAAPPTPAAAPAAAPAKNCDPPYTVDRAGIKRAKPECL